MGAVPGKLPGMDRPQPEYLAKLPKDRHGLAWTVGIGVVLAITMVGAWQVYVGTVRGWEARFNAPKKAISPTVREVPAEAVLAEQRLRELAAARSREPAVIVDRCINGVAFRRLPDGGWENLPKVRCE